MGTASPASRGRALSARATRGTDTGHAIARLTQPAARLDGLLAWTLAALIIGHAAMALLHGLRRDGMLGRMGGVAAQPRRAPQDRMPGPMHPLMVAIHIHYGRSNGAEQSAR